MTESPAALRATLAPFLNDEPGPPPAAPERQAPPAAADADAGQRHARCERRTRAVFEGGEYASLVINRCRGVVVRGARIGALRALHSTVEIEDSEIGTVGSGGGSALYARSSTLIVTGGRIAGDVPITALSSRLDLAGVQLVAREAVVVAPANASVVFSLCRLETPAGTRFLHGYDAVVPGRPLRGGR